MLFRAVFGLFVAVLLASPALAGKKAPKKSASEEKVCRKVEETGSIFLRKVCRTPDEWAAQDSANGEQVQRMRDRDRGGGYEPHG